MKSNSRSLSIRPTAKHAGGAVLSAMIFIVVLSALVATVLSRAMNTYRQVSHVASWQEALLAAEAGSDTAVAELRKTIIDPSSAFAGWTTTAPDGTFLPNSGMQYTCPQLVHGGEGNSRLDMAVTIDVPPQLIDGSGRQWYRVRSTGTTYLPGPGLLTTDKRDHLLRRFSFLRNPKTNQAVTRPQSTRLVELIVKPTSFENAITSDQAITLNNFKIVVDSYDSRYSTTSTAGLYDVTKRMENGDIATNSQLIEAGDAHIYGDAYTNDGVINNGANITGDQRTDWYQELLPIGKPNWTTFQTIGNINNDTTLVGGSKSNPVKYKVSQISLASKNLTVAPSAPGVDSYTEIWLTGDLKASGNGSIVIQPNANLKVFIEGDIDIKGNGTFNANSQPVHLQILGVKTIGVTHQFNFAGNGNVVGAIYAPNHDMVFGATGSAGTFWGALTARKITMGGTTYIHYDEALADAGHIIDYKIKSWFEDNK